MLNNEKLKTSFIGGYNKRKVLELISEIDSNATERINHINSILKEKVNEIEALKSEITNLKEDVLIKETAIKNLQSLLDEKDIAIEKQRPFEEISKTIGDVMVSVQSTCEKIIADSKAEAANIISDTDEKILSIGSNMVRSKQAFAQSKEQISRYMSTLENSLNQILSELENTETALKLGPNISDKSLVFDKCKEETGKNISNIIDIIKKSPAAN